MKKHALASIIAFFVIVTTFAQPTLQWTSRFNGPVAADKGNVITLDVSGNVYVTGSSDGVSVGSDYLTIKYDTDGNILWSQRYNGSANGIDVAVAIKVDGAGNVYVTGKSQGNGTGYNIVTIKYNSSGNQQWASTYGGTGDEFGYNLVVDDATGNIFVIGSYSNGATVIKYNSSGSQQWAKSISALYDPLNGEIEYFIAINAYNNIVVAVNDNQAWGNYLLHELNPSNGNIIFTYNTPPVLVFRGTPRGLVLDITGHMYVLSTEHNAFGTPIEINIARFSHGNAVADWSNSRSAGELSGQKIDGIDLKVDVNLNVYIVSKLFISSAWNPVTSKFNHFGAYLGSVLTFTPGIDGIPVSLSLTSVINPNIIVGGYTATGNITISGYANNFDPLWNQIVYDCGNNGNDIASAMIMDKCNNIFITGSSNCNGTNQDVKTLKYSALVSTITPNGPTTFCQGGSVTLAASTADNYLWSNGATTQSIMVSTSGLYFVTVTASGCSAVSSGTTVSVNPIPNVNVLVNNNNPTICAGQAATLMASGAANYQWSTGSTTNPIIVYPSSSTTYTVIGTTAAQCSSSATAQVLVTPLPIVTVNSATICAGQSTILTASTNGAATYQWNTGATTNSITVNPVLNTTYTVMGTTALCSSTATGQVFVNPLITPSLSLAGSSVFCLGQNVTFTATPTNEGPTPIYEWFVNNIFVGTGPSYSSSTLANGDQLYCRMTSNAACASPATVNSSTTVVTVLALPNVQIATSGPTTFCSDTSVILTAIPSGTKYLWSPGGETTKSITVFTSGDYTVAVTATNTCSGVSAPTTVTVNPLPPTPSIFPPGPISLCEGEIILTSSFADAYLWNTEETTQSITVSILGYYSVIVTDQNGCSKASDPTIVECIMGASEASLPEGFSISPNPSTGSFTVKFILPETKMVSQRVLNVLGQVVWAAAPRLAAGEYRREIELGTAVMPGIYFLETRLDGRALLRKIEVR